MKEKVVAAIRKRLSVMPKDQLTRLKTAVQLEKERRNSIKKK
jgi:hypothetical protein